MRFSFFFFFLFKFIPIYYNIIGHVEGFDIPDYKEARKYYTNGKVKSLPDEQCIKAFEGDMDAMNFYFVYYFNAHFNEGLNIVQHTYEYDLSGSVDEVFYFQYILTAANRWANHRIDDFTLNIDMGPRASFGIEPSFFKRAKAWTLNGHGRVSKDEDRHVFHMQDGSITFKKKKFHPKGELYVNKRYYVAELGWLPDGQKVTGDDVLKAMKYNYDDLRAPVFDEYVSVLSAQQKRVMKNMPFAYHGYVFNDKDLQHYFESTNWYIPDPNFKGDMASMSDHEKKWIEYWSK